MNKYFKLEGSSMIEKIVVKTSVKNVRGNKYWFFIWLGITAMLLYVCNGKYILTSIISVFLFFKLFFNWIAYGKTLIFTSEGVTLRRLFLNRQYSWSQLQTKRYVLNNDSILTGKRKWVVKYGAEFSVKAIESLKKVDCETYGFWHPISFFYVCFEDNNTQEAYNTYLIKEETFRTALKEWGVSMEDYK